MEPVRVPNPPYSNLLTYLRCLALSKGFMPGALELARQHKNVPGVSMTFSKAIDAGMVHQKTGVDAGDMSTSGWASQLVSYGVGRELIRLQDGASIFGMLIPSMHELPMRIPTPIETSGPASYWVGEAAAKPISRLTLGSNITLEYYKFLSATTATDELLRFGRPAADAALINALKRALSRNLDNQFLNPSISLIAGTRPAAVTAGDNVQVSSGSTSAQIQSDLSAMAASLISWENLFFILSPATAITLASKFNVAGARQFPDISVKGGSIMGIPAIVNPNISGLIILLDAAAIVYQRELVNLSVSKEINLEMESSPAAGEQSPTSAITNLKSMWQSDMTAFLCEFGVSYLRTHDDSTCAMSVNY